MKSWIGKQFIKPFTKTGAESVASWKSKAAKAKLKMAKENLEQTFKKTDKEQRWLCLMHDLCMQSVWPEVRNLTRANF